MTLYDNLLLSISFIYSHPLHLAYLLYFSPYILQLFSFLFPLLLTTSILVSVLSLHFILEGDTPTVCLLTQVSSLVVDSIGNVFEWEFETMGELYKDLGLACEEVRKDPVEIFVQGSENGELLETNVESGEREGSRFEPENVMNRISSLDFDQREDPDEIYSKNLTRSEVLELQDQVNLKGDSLAPQTPDRVCVQSLQKGHQHSETKQDPTQIFLKFPEKVELLKCQSERRGSFNSENTSRMPRNSLSVRRIEQEGRGLEGLQRGGSRRKEKEWKRTLACKLYEERMSVRLCEKEMAVEEGEEMDLLWEDYEAETIKFKNKGKSKKKESYIVEEDDREEDEEGDESVGQLCCLQALRLSTSKMNFGVGRPNIGRISEAFKGVGLFHHSSRSQK